MGFILYFIEIHSNTDCFEILKKNQGSPYWCLTYSGGFSQILAKNKELLNPQKVC